MKHKLRVYLIFIIVLILAFIFAEQTGTLYENISNDKITGTWISGCAKCFEGFIIIFSFLASLLFFGFIDRNRVNIALTSY